MLHTAAEGNVAEPLRLGDLGLLPLTATSGLFSTVAPTVADKSASGSLAAACAWAMTADAMTAGASVGTSISRARLTLAAVTRSTA